MFFWIFLGIDLITAAVFVYFFFVGLADGSVSAFNIVLWLVTLGGIAAITGGGWTLNRGGRRRAANAVLAILAVPAFGFGLFMLMLILTNPRWN